MADKNYYSSFPSPSNASNPFMQHLPNQHGASQSHVLNNPAVQNNNTFSNPPNVVEVQTPQSFASSARNLHYYQGSGSGSGSVGNSIPGLNELESAMGGLSLRYPFGNSTNNGVQFPAAADGSGPNNFSERVVYDYEDPLPNGNGYYMELLLLKMRSCAAAAALRGQDSYSPTDINFLNSVNGRYLDQMPNGNSYVPHLNGVNGVGNYNYFDRYNLAMDGSRGTVGSLPRANRLEGVRRGIVSIAKDQCGCRMLQSKIDEGKERDIQLILSGVMYHMPELMMHHFGNYLIQKIFESSSVSEEQKNFLVNSIIQDVHQLRNVCKDTHGTRAIQRMIENLKTEKQIKDVTNVMKQITAQLMKNSNGGYVIQQCVKIFPTKFQEEILHVIAMNCIDIATDKSGCSIIQKCMQHAEREALMPLVRAIISNAALLAEDPFGNYVVQYLIEMEMLRVNSMIKQVLCGRFAQLSRNKHASNVVQQLLKFSEGHQAEEIVKELMDSPEFVTVLQDPFGNYVAQSALDFSKGYLRRRLLLRIEAMSPDQGSHLYGKMVLAHARKLQKIRL
ncbi:hypothetical protein RIF29_22694 [Crotalaria pallida]|uniref:PUM-HD domain-containing protein n=1 Tax=Crotalaria pallida TaxID=3830 RepID=A0AAN9FDR3_CROPI